MPRPVTDPCPGPATETRSARSVPSVMPWEMITVPLGSGLPTATQVLVLEMQETPSSPSNPPSIAASVDQLPLLHEYASGVLTGFPLLKSVSLPTASHEVVDGHETLFRTPQSPGFTDGVWTVNELPFQLSASGRTVLLSPDSPTAMHARVPPQEMASSCPPVALAGKDTGSGLQELPSNRSAIGCCVPFALL